MAFICILSIVLRLPKASSSSKFWRPYLSSISFSAVLGGCWSASGSPATGAIISHVRRPSSAIFTVKVLTEILVLLVLLVAVVGV